MDAEPAKDYLFKKTLALDPEQFEQLCKMMLARLEKTENTELTPFRKDGGIDVRARIDRDLFYADLGVQAKRYAPSNTIGSSGMQKFSGALGSQDFNVGAFITSSTFTKPAEKESNQAFMPIKLINGPDLMGILIQNEIGIGKEEPGVFVPDYAFWNAFDTPEKTDIIPSIEVPQADSIETLQYVLEAIDLGHDTKTSITEFVAPKMGGFRTRQSDYYGVAGWLLGFLHKEKQVQDGRKSIRRWG